MERLETRELAYFVAVAEELHFGRAAVRLGIAQPPLSRAIKQLERRMDVTLLVRGSRGVTLTPAGEVLLQEGRKALDAVAAAGRRAQRVGRVDNHLLLAMKPGADSGLLPAILQAYGSEPGTIPVRVVVGGIGQQTAMLRDGTADAALLHSPHEDLTGLDSEDLCTERQVVVLPQGHRLADRPHVCLADLDGEPMPRWPGTPPDETDAGLPELRDGGQLMQLIALGQVIAVLPESVRDHLRYDLVHVPVIDAEPTTLVLAWPEGSRSPALATLVRAAARVAASHDGARPRSGYATSR